MEQEKNNKGVIVLLILIIIILAVLCVLFATGTISFKSNETANNQSSENTNTNEETNTKSIYEVCTAEDSAPMGTADLKILDMENKTEKIHGCCGDMKMYNLITTVTKEHSYTSTPDVVELYANDFLKSLFVVYNNKLYYTNNKEIISKYCNASTEDSSKFVCDYSKITSESINKFDNIINDVNFKAVGSFGNTGSGAPTPYGITMDGKIIQITSDTNGNYNGCRVMYDDTTYPIDRVFKMSFYGGNEEYEILLKDGTLISRTVDKEHPLESEN